MIETLDFDQLVEDLADGTPPVFLTPERICVQDLIVVAALVKPGQDRTNPGRTRGEAGAKPTRYLGLLGARDDTAGGQAFLRLDMACVAPPVRGQRLVSRLLACAAAERIGRTPILAARTATPSWFRALRHFATDLAGTAFHPAPAGAVITAAHRGAGASDRRCAVSRASPRHRHRRAARQMDGAGAAAAPPRLGRCLVRGHARRGAHAGRAAAGGDRPLRRRQVDIAGARRAHCIHRVTRAPRFL